MSEKLKIKVNGTVSESDIPYGTEYLELDCKVIGKSAFRDHEKLKSVTLLNTEVIDENAFEFCISLREVKLPDTLQEIGKRAFSQSGIRHLVIPPGVTEIGEDILESGTIEIYLKDGVLPVKPGVRPAENGTLLVVRSPETNEVLCKFVLLGSPDIVLTKHGIDFTEYDKMFNDRFLGYCYGLDTTIRAAKVRLHNSVGMSRKTMELLKEYIPMSIAFDIEYMINENSIEELEEYPYLDDIDTERFLNLIDYSAQQGKTEMTAVLMQKLHERRISENNE